MLEKHIERKFCEKCIKISGRALKFVSPGMNGVPDRIALFPHGKIVFIEFKAPGRKLRPLQEKRKEELEALGFKVYVIDSVEGVEEAIDELTQLSKSN
jgi:hypothetical protein